MLHILQVNRKKGEFVPPFWSENSGGMAEMGLSTRLPIHLIVLASVGTHGTNLHAAYSPHKLQVIHIGCRIII